ncbi:MAG: AAA family ATPase [Deferribacterales bacterium]
MQALLKRCLRENGISQAQLSKTAGFSPAALSLAVKGVFPAKREQFDEKIAKAFEVYPKLTEWMDTNEYTMADLWLDDEESGKIGRGRIAGQERKKPFQLKKAAEFEAEPEEAEMINMRTMKYFKLFKNPFVGDINSVDDIYYSEDHLFVKEMILSTAHHKGMFAVYGEVGCGKSAIRMAAAEQLEDEGIKVIFPQILDKSSITPESLLDAIIMDIAPEEKPKIRREQKSRQAIQLLTNRCETGYQQVLFIEDAELLNIKALKSVKRIAELKNGFQSLCGVVFFGQPELETTLSDKRHDLRELTRRMDKAQITGMTQEEVEKYLIHKFNRVGCKNISTIFAKDAYEAIYRKLKSRGKLGDVEYHTYPLTINNLVAKAMNFAANIGEELVTADVIFKA